MKAHVQRPARLKCLPLAENYLPIMYIVTWLVTIYFLYMRTPLVLRHCCGGHENLLVDRSVHALSYTQSLKQNDCPFESSSLIQSIHTMIEVRGLLRTSYPCTLYQKLRLQSSLSRLHPWQSLSQDVPARQRLIRKTDKNSSTIWLLVS